MSDPSLPAAGAKRRRRFRLAVVAVLIVVVAFLAIPVRVACGYDGYACAAEAEDGDVTYYYEWQPIGVSLLEGLLDRDIDLYYADGHT